MTASQHVTTIVHHKVDIAKKSLYLDWQQRLTQASKQFDGYINTTLIEPGFVTSNENEYVIIFTFTDQNSLKHWQDSAVRQQLLGQASEFSLETPKLSTFTGLEHWFIDANKTPSRVKMTCVSFVAIWPLVHFIPPQLDKVLAF